MKNEDLLWFEESNQITRCSLEKGFFPAKCMRMLRGMYLIAAVVELEEADVIKAFEKKGESGESHTMSAIYRACCLKNLMFT